MNAIDPPRVYCSSPTRHAAMWRNWKEGMPSVIRIVSTWHDNIMIDTDDLDPHICRSHWGRNRAQILFGADHLLVFAGRADKPNGTLVEIGIAFGLGIPVHLVGTFAWGSWRHHRLFHIHSSLHDALRAITGASGELIEPITAYEEYPPDDPS